MPGSLLLIAVVWIVLLTPLVLFNRRPVRKTSEALTETRLVHSGGSELRGKRKLRPSPALYTADDSDEELELVDAEPEYVLLDDEGTESTQPASGKGHTAGKSVAVARQGKRAVDVTGAEVVDGELVEDEELDAKSSDNASVREAEERADEAVVDSDIVDQEAGDEDADSAAVEATLTGDTSPADANSDEDTTSEDISDEPAETGMAHKVDASSYKSQDETDTGEFEPVAEEDVVAALKRKKGSTKLSKKRFSKSKDTRTGDAKAYGMEKTDEANTSDVHDDAAQETPKPVEVPIGVLRGVDYDDSRGREDHVRELANVGTARPVENLYESMELSEDDMNYIAARRGRGVYDPVASAEANRRRQQRRKHVLLGMVALLMLSLAFAIWRGGALWLAPVLMTGLTIFYLVALRKNAIEEAKLRRRRLARMRRARLGVRNTEDRELGVIPERLMRPGAVIIEPDEADVELHNLAIVDSHEFFHDDDHDREYHDRDYYDDHIRAI
ncbi:gephyrin-like molybdotransferase receptor GlpR [uncultured Corynebacterium sp.]|uniref:divisome protein SepX/GlpR n=1 Tax=uncultured Corynebacterium sp. TaxID=159447 RepID=UPI0025E1DF1F|nr:gephyrin-like molybdotransferase receptor GlpR [uncultured Corynebacterium sp.]